jgi:serine/threonine protein kinase
MRVLAADDDEAMARVLDRHLRGWGYEATIARSGIEAWRILKREDSPRVVILDVDMPGLSGLEVCRLLRSTAHGASAYVLMLTGRAEKEDLIQALESGADDFLSKPFHVRELQLRLAKGIRDSARESSVRDRPSRDVPTSGSTLAGKYRLERKIGDGGMGSVWLGVHLSLGINVAIKFMAPDLADTAHYASFEREARAAAQLRNQHIVRVYDHGIAGGGLPYLVMEYLAGESLADWVERRGALSSCALASLVAQTSDALTEAHDRGVVHRDVKADNILMVENADDPVGFVVKLIDFGLAKPYGGRVAEEGVEVASLEAGAPTSSANAGPLVAGTPDYMSPECLTAAAPPSPLLDLWGLAVTAFFATTGGVLPFEGKSLSELHQRVCLDPLPRASEVASGVPEGFDAWFARACAREPDARFQSAAELSAALSAVCNAAPELTRKSAPGLVKGLRVLAPTEPELAAIVANESKRH